MPGRRRSSSPGWLRSWWDSGCFGLPVRCGWHVGVFFQAANAAAVYRHHRPTRSIGYNVWWTNFWVTALLQWEALNLRLPWAESHTLLCPVLQLSYHVRLVTSMWLVVLLLFGASKHWFFFGEIQYILPSKRSRCMSEVISETYSSYDEKHRTDVFFW